VETGRNRFVGLIKNLGIDFKKREKEKRVKRDKRVKWEKRGSYFMNFMNFITL